MPGSAWTTKLVHAVIGWPDRSTPAGIDSETVSGTLIAYAANCGTLMLRRVSLTRVRSVGTRPRLMIAFQPAGSA